MFIDDIYFAAVEDVKQVESITAGRATLDGLKQKYNLENVVYHSQRSPGPESDLPFLLLTYPQS